MPRVRNDEYNRKRQDEFLKAFAEIGVIKPAAAAIGSSPICHYQWLANYPDYAERFETIRRQCEANGTAKAHRKRTGRQPGSKLSTGLYAESRAERKGPFVEALRGGMTFQRATASIHASLASVYRWMREDEQFAEEVRLAREASEALVKERANTARRDKMAELWDDPARRARMSEVKKAMWDDEERRSKRSEMMLAQWGALDTDARTARLANMRKAIKGGVTVTDLEAKVMMALNDLQTPYLAHYVIGTFSADFFIPSHNVIVEADGDYAHRDHEADAERDAALAALGFTVLHLSEQEIKAGDFSKLVEALA